MPELMCRPQTAFSLQLQRDYLRKKASDGEAEWFAPPAADLRNTGDI